MSKITIFTALDLLKSSSSREQKEGLLDLKHLFSSLSSLSLTTPSAPTPTAYATPTYSTTSSTTLQPREWQLIFDALFSLIAADRANLKRKSFDARLALSASVLRELCAALAPNLNAHPWAVKAVIEHVPPVLLVGEDAICDPLALDYLRCLGIVVSVPGVVERLRERWGAVAELCLEVCRRVGGDSHAAGTGSSAGPSAGGSGGSASQDGNRLEIAETMLILRRLTAAPNAPLIEYSTQLVNLGLSLLGTKRGLVDVLGMFANILDRLVEEDGGLAKRALVDSLKRLRAAWGKDKAVKEEILRILLIGRHHLLAVAADDSDAAEDLQSLVSAILSEYDRRPVEQLRMDDVRVYVVGKGEPTSGHPFRTPAFGLREGEREGRWLVPWLAANLLSATRTPPTDTLNRKRQRLGSDGPSLPQPAEKETGDTGKKKETSKTPVELEYFLSALQTPSSRVSSLQAIAMYLSKPVELQTADMAAVLRAVIGLLPTTVAEWCFLVAANASTQAVSRQESLQPMWHAISSQSVQRGTPAAAVASGSICQLWPDALPDGLSVSQLSGWSVNGGTVGMISTALGRSHCVRLRKRILHWVSERWAGTSSASVDPLALANLFLMCAGQAGARVRAKRRVILERLGVVWESRKADADAGAYLLSGDGRILEAKKKSWIVRAGEDEDEEEDVEEWPPDRVSAMAEILEFWKNDLGRILSLFDPDPDADDKRASQLEPLARHATISVIVANSLVAHSPPTLFAEAERTRQVSESLLTRLLEVSTTSLGEVLERSEESELVRVVEHCVPDVRYIQGLQDFRRAGILPMLLRMAAVWRNMPSDHHTFDTLPTRRTLESATNCAVSMRGYLFAAAKLADALFRAEGNGSEQLVEVPTAAVDALVALPTTPFLCAHEFVLGLLANPRLRMKPKIIVRLLTHVGDTILKDGRVQLAEVTVTTMIRLAIESLRRLNRQVLVGTHGSGGMAGQANGTIGAGEDSDEDTARLMVDDFFDWLSGMIPKKVLSRASFRYLIDLLELDLLASSPPDDIEQIRASNLLEVLESGPVVARVRACLLLPLIFPLDLATHSTIFLLIDALVPVTDAAADVAVRSLALVVMTAGVPTMRRSGVLAMVETASHPVAERFLSGLAQLALEGMGTMRVDNITTTILRSPAHILVLYDRYLLSNWVATGKSIKRWLFWGAFRMSGPSELVDNVGSQMVVECVNLRKDNLLRELSGLRNQTVQKSIGRSFVRVAATCLVRGIDTLYRHMSKEDVRQNLMVNFGKVLGELVTFIDDPDIGVVGTVSPEARRAWNDMAVHADPFSIRSLPRNSGSRTLVSGLEFRAAVVQLRQIAYPDKVDPNSGEVFHFPAPVYTSALRELASTIERQPNMPSLLVTLVQIRLFISIVQPAAVSVYPFQVVVPVLVGILLNSVPARDQVDEMVTREVAALFHGMLQTASDGLRIAPRHAASVLVPLILFLRAQPTPVNPRDLWYPHRATQYGQQESVKIVARLVRAIGATVKKAVPKEGERDWARARKILLRACADPADPDESDDAATALLFDILDDWMDEPVMSDQARSEALKRLIADGAIPMEREMDEATLGRWRPYLPALWEARRLDLPMQYSVWIAKLLGFVEMPIGEIEAAQKKVESASWRTRRFADGNYCQMIVEMLYTRLQEKYNSFAAGIIESSLRQIIDNGGTDDLNIPSDIIDALRSGACIKNSYKIIIDLVKNLPEFFPSDVGPDWSVPVGVWSRRFALGLIKVRAPIFDGESERESQRREGHGLAESAVLQALVAPLAHITNLASDTLGPIVGYMIDCEASSARSVSHSQSQRRRKGSAPIKAALEAIFHDWFSLARDRQEGKDVPGNSKDQTDIIKLILDVLIFLPPGSITVDPLLCANAAMLVGSPVRALYFAETVGTASSLSTPLYQSILPALPDPDARYALPQPPGLDAVLTRLSKGVQSGPTRLMVHAARAFARVRDNQDISNVDSDGIRVALGEMGVRRAIEGDHMADRKWAIYEQLRVVGTASRARKVLDGAARELIDGEREYTDKIRRRLFFIADMLNVCNGRTLVSPVGAGIKPNSTFYSVLAGNTRLVSSLKMSTEASTRLEISQVLASIRYAHKTGNHQDALSRVEYLKLIQPRALAAGINISSVINVEGAATLWEVGEREVSIGLLRQVLSAPPDDAQFRVPPANVMCQLAHHLDIARLEQPDQILSNYLQPAARLTGPEIAVPVDAPREIAQLATDPIEAGAVYHQFALFCDTQLKSSDHLDHIARLKRAVHRRRADAAAADAVLKTSRSRSAGKALAAHLHASRTWAELDRRELEQVKQSWIVLLTSAVENYIRALAISDAHDEDLLKLLSLWLEYAAVGHATDAVRRVAGAIPSRKWVAVIHQLTSRLSADPDTAEFQSVLGRIVSRVCVEHGIIAMHHLYAAIQTDSKTEHASSAARDAIQLRAEAASAIAHELVKHPVAGPLWKRIKAADAAFSHVASTVTDTSGAQFRGSTEITLDRIPHARALVKASSGVPLPTMSIGLSPRADCDYSSVPTIVGFRSRVLIAQGLSAPKIVVARLTDGREYKLLIKGGSDDLRQDAVMEQVFAHTSRMLSAQPETAARKLGVRTYAVLPLSPTTGLIEFVANTISLNDYLIPAHAKHNPSDLSASDCRQRIAAVATADTAKRVRVFESVCARFRPVLRHFFDACASPEQWYRNRLAYARSMAAISMVGHVLGLGDRHGQNILLDKQSGEVVHIDLGVAFDAGRILPVPEVVPFRLTRDLVDPLGAAGVEGTFRRCCEAVLEALRNERDGVQTLLGVLRYDPLHQWTVSARQVGRVQGEAGQAGGGGGHYLEPDNDEDAAEEEARRALGAVERKLGTELSTAAAVSELLAEAMDVRNLAVLFAGWGAYL